MYWHYWPLDMFCSNEMELVLGASNWLMHCNYVLRREDIRHFHRTRRIWIQCLMWCIQQGLKGSDSTTSWISCISGMVMMKAVTTIAYKLYIRIDLHATDLCEILHSTFESFLYLKITQADMIHSQAAKDLKALSYWLDWASAHSQ